MITHVDITLLETARNQAEEARKQAEDAREQVEAARRRLHAILRQSQSAIGIINEKDENTFYNDRLLSMWKVSAEEIERFKKVPELKRYLW